MGTSCANFDEKVLVQLSLGALNAPSQPELIEVFSTA